MPKFTPLPVPKLPLLNADLLPIGHGRAVGLHLGEILNAIDEENGEAKSSIEGEDPSIRPLIGFLWERAVDLVWTGVPLSAALEVVWKEYLQAAELEIDDRGYVEHQLKVELDGVLMTPDGLAFTASERVPLRSESYKSTSRSMRKWEEDARSCNEGLPPEHFGRWLMAEACYLKAISELAKQPVRTCRFFICWQRGDYSWKVGRGMQMTVTDVTWTGEEIEAEWRRAVQMRDVILKRRAA